MMWTYEYRGQIFVGDEDEVLERVDPDAAFAMYLDNEYPEVEVLRHTYSPAEVFSEWSEEDFSRAASDWFEDAIYNPTRDNLSYFEEIDVRPATPEDIRVARVDTGIDRVGARSAGMTAALQRRGSGSGTAKPKAKAGARPKTASKTTKPKPRAKASNAGSKPKAAQKSGSCRSKSKGARR